MTTDVALRDRIQAYARLVAEAAPPLTSEQVARLHSIFAIPLPEQPHFWDGLRPKARAAS